MSKERPGTEPPLFNPDTDKLYTTTQVAEMFTVKPETVRDWINTGKLPALRLGSGHLRVTLRELTAFASHHYQIGDTSAD